MMSSFFYLIIFVFGLAVGSFLNCVIYRLEHKELSSFMRGRSFCPYCKHILNWQDLIPLFSFLILKGKCHYCKKPISLQYPLVELITGALFVLVLNHELGIMNHEFFSLEIILNSLFLILTSCFLIIIFVYDLKHFIIPDRIIYPVIFIVLGFRAWGLIGHWSLGFEMFKPLMYPLLAAIFASGFFLSVVLLSRGRWMGLGDVKLAFFMGLFLSFPNILAALFLSFFIGGIIGIGLILAKKKGLKSEIPFGPFLVTGTFIALFWGQSLINWYLNLFTI